MSDRWLRKRALASKLQKAHEAKLRRSEPCNGEEDHQSVGGEGSSELLTTQSTSQPNVSDDEVVSRIDSDDSSPDEDFAFSPDNSKAVI